MERFLQLFGGFVDFTYVVWYCVDTMNGSSVPQTSSTFSATSAASILLLPRSLPAVPSNIASGWMAMPLDATYPSSLLPRGRERKI